MTYSKDFSSIDNEVWFLDISSSQKIILIYLHSRAYGKKNTCFPTIDQISQNTGICQRSIIQNLKKLSETGLINITKHKSRDSKYTNNFYTLADVRSPQFIPLKYFNPEEDSEELEVSDSDESRPIENTSKYSKSIDPLVIQFYQHYQALNLKRWHGNFPGSNQDIKIISKIKKECGENFINLFFKIHLMDDMNINGNLSLAHSHSIYKKIESETEFFVVKWRILEKFMQKSKVWSREKQWDLLKEFDPEKYEDSKYLSQYTVPSLGQLRKAEHIVLESFLKREGL